MDNKISNKIKNSINKVDLFIESITGRWEFITVLLLSLLIVFGVVCGMGTLTSGFHLVDDHEFLKWQYNMQYEGQSLWQLISLWIPRDLGWRYEPAYYTTRILGVGIFGTNLINFSVLKALEIVIALMFLYYCGKLMGAKKVYSFLFATISLVGYQSAIWWKLGPQEAQCTMLFAIGFFCMLKWLHGNQKNWGIASIVLFFIMCNYKESFILLLPFIVCLVLYDTAKNRMSRDEKYTPIEFIKVLLVKMKGRYWYVLSLVMIFLILVAIILFYVGVNNYSGAGLNSAATFSIYKEAFFRALNSDLKWYKRFGIVLIAILLTYWDDLKKLWMEILLTIAFLLPQFVIFAQTGILERYMLPSTIGFAFFFVLIISKWKPLKNGRRFIYMTAIVLMLLTNARAMLVEADYFRYRGESVTGMLESVYEIADEDTKVLSCFRPNEEANLTLHYWMLLNNIDGIYYWTEGERIINKVHDIHMSYSDPAVYEAQDFDEMDIVVMYNQQDRHFSFNPSLDLSGFTEVNSGTITIWVRDDSGIELAQPKIKESIFN